MATRKISTRLAIEGESAYKQAIRDCNNEIKTMRSALALVQSQYQTNANGTEALRAKSEALGRAFVCEHLKASGVTAIRMDDTTGATDVPLADRTAKANREDCALYVSIHHDSGINGGTGGGITCFMHPSGSAKAKALRDAIYERTVETTGLRGDRANPKTTANFYVLRKTKMPAMLIECGFMDSRTDTPIILTDAFAREAAKGIAEGICETLGITMKEVSTMDNTNSIPQTVSSWAKDDWDWAKAQGLLDGTRPKDPVTREELAAVLHRMSKKA